MASLNIKLVTLIVAMVVILASYMHSASCSPSIFGVRGGYHRGGHGGYGGHGGFGGGRGYHGGYGGGRGYHGGYGGGRGYHGGRGGRYYHG